MTAATVTGDQVYDFAALCGLVTPDVLAEYDTPPENVERLLRRLFPDWDRPQLDGLWERARIDAAALDQARRLDTWSYPIVEMSPPSERDRGRFGAFTVELELSVSAAISAVSR